MIVIVVVVIVVQVEVQRGKKHDNESQQITAKKELIYHISHRILPLLIPTKGGIWVSWNQ